MDISRISTCTGNVLKLSGDIRDGDFVRFRGHVTAEQRVVGLHLDSTGGSLHEGFRIAMLAHRRQIASYVSGECDSACAFIFLASRKRYVTADAKIGVHAVGNMQGNEDSGTLRDTIRLARLSAKLGIPPSAIGKMVTTPPGKITFLSKEDLAALKAIERNPFDHVGPTVHSKIVAACGTTVSKGEGPAPTGNMAGGS